MTLSTHCGRCNELAIVEIVESWGDASHVTIDDVNGPVLKRFFFDEHKANTDSCITCSKLFANRRVFAFSSSKVYNPHKTVLADMGRILPTVFDFTYSGGHPYIVGTIRETGKEMKFGITHTPQAVSGTRINRYKLLELRPDFDFVDSCIRECSARHSRYCGQLPEVRPHNIRAVNVQYRMIVQLPDNEKYIALSYVWGASPQPTLPGGRALPAKVPLTVEHAIAIVKRLDVDYL